MKKKYCKIFFESNMFKNKVFKYVLGFFDLFLYFFGMCGVLCN